MNRAEIVRRHRTGMELVLVGTSSSSPPVGARVYGQPALNSGLVPYKTFETTRSSSNLIQFQISNVIWSWNGHSDFWLLEYSICLKKLLIVLKHYSSDLLTQLLETKIFWPRLKGKQNVTRVSRWPNFGLYGGRCAWTDTGLAGRTPALARELARSAAHPCLAVRVSHGQRRPPQRHQAPPQRPSLLPGRGRYRPAVFNFRATPVGR